MEAGIVMFFTSPAYITRPTRTAGDFLTARARVVLSGSTDGFSFCDGAGHSMWPVLFWLNNLPPPLRFRLKNVVLATLVPGPEKPPHMQHLLLPLCDELRISYNVGFDIPSAAGELVCKAVVMHMVLDLQGGRALVL